VVRNRRYWDPTTAQRGSSTWLSQRKIIFVRSRIRCSFALIFYLICWSLPALCQQAATRHSHVELIARHATIVPGKEVQLGVHFVLEKGWHIYWINPGDSGQPPVFKWHLPEGFTPGNIQWPRPQRIQTVKELADYGYHDEVLLIVPVRAPQIINPNQDQSGAKLKFAMEAKWLVCREVCLPDHATVELDLPYMTKAKDDPATDKLFTNAEKMVPVALPRGWKVNASDAKGEFRLTITADKKINQAEFFPLEPGQIDNPAPQKVQPSASGCSITLKKSDLLLKPIAVLRGVLVIPGGAAYRIEAPVRESLQ
jgi:DsbC/DsbD-like thiol-disulfide interchange protein